MSELGTLFCLFSSKADSLELMLYLYNTLTERHSASDVDCLSRKE